MNPQAEEALFAPAFRHRKLGWLFAASVGIMVYIASLAMAAEASLSSFTLSWNEGMVSHMTVEVPAADDESSTPQAERVKQVLAVLRAAPEIAKAVPVPEEETARLLKPWIPDEELIKKLPLPVLIEVDRKPGKALSADALEAKLKPVVADIHVDDHAAWLADLSRFVKGLAIAAGLMVGLIAASLVIAISLICRAAMATERETIELLGTMGAEDGAIAWHFERHARRLSWLPALAGFVLAVATLAALLFMLRDVADVTMLWPSRWLGLLLPVALVPLGAVLAASLSARAAVLRLLRAPQGGAA